jgi:hypothetical protein
MSDQMIGNEPAAADGAEDGLAPAAPIADTAWEDVAPAEAAGAAAAWAAAQTDSVVTRAKTIASTAPSEMTSRAKGMLKESTPSQRGVGGAFLVFGAFLLGFAYLLYRRAKAGDSAGAAAAV